MYFQVYTGCVGSYNPTWLNWGQPDPDSCFSKTTAPKGGSTSCYIVNSLLLPTSYTSAVNPMGCGGDSSGGGAPCIRTRGPCLQRDIPLWWHWSAPVRQVVVSPSRLPLPVSFSTSW